MLRWVTSFNLLNTGVLQNSRRAQQEFASVGLVTHPSVGGDGGKHRGGVRGPGYVANRWVQVKGEHGRAAKSQNNALLEHLHNTHRQITILWPTFIPKAYHIWMQTWIRCTVRSTVLSPHISHFFILPECTAKTHYSATDGPDHSFCSGHCHNGTGKSLLLLLLLQVQAGARQSPYWPYSKQICTDGVGEEVGQQDNSNTQCWGCANAVMTKWVAWQNGAGY